MPQIFLFLFSCIFESFSLVSTVKVYLLFLTYLFSSKTTSGQFLWTVVELGSTCFWPVLSQWHCWKPFNFGGKYLSMMCLLSVALLPFSLAHHCLCGFQGCLFLVLFQKSVEKHWCALKSLPGRDHADAIHLMSCCCAQLCNICFILNVKLSPHHGNTFWLLFT